MQNVEGALFSAQLRCEKKKVEMLQISVWERRRPVLPWYTNEPPLLLFDYRVSIVILWSPTSASVWTAGLDETGTLRVKEAAAVVQALEWDELLQGPEQKPGSTAVIAEGRSQFSTACFVNWRCTWWRGGGLFRCQSNGHVQLLHSAVLLYTCCGIVPVRDVM